MHVAGVLPPERQESAQGHELVYATHVLGPFLLTHLLRPLLRADGDARVVWVSSGGMYTRALDASDPEAAEREWSGTDAYARTKRMQVALGADVGRPDAYGPRRRARDAPGMGGDARA